MIDEKVNPFDSFSVVYEILIWAGYFKLQVVPKNRFKRIGHTVYRFFAVMVTIWYNISHIIFIIQSYNRGNMDDVFDCVMIEIPQLSLLVKIFSLNYHISRVDKIHELINAAIFAAYTKKDEELILENTRKMHRWARIIKMSITVTIFLWPASFIMRRYQDPTALVSAYTPFETDTWAKYSYSVLLEVLPIPWVGYGHLALDCVVATYYAQAEVQLKIIKYNLEHLFDTNCAHDRCYFVYRDVVDEGLRKRFVHFVQRYEAIAWYTKEIGHVFNISMSFEFLSSIASLCVTVYRMSSTVVMSVQFSFLVILLVIMLTQVFLYCYFGNLVNYESDSVVTSAYLSDWVSASPRFRRLILIAMLRWSRGLAPKVARIVPLSLHTFVSILRSTYSMFAVLKTV